MPSLFGYFQPGNSCKLQILHGSLFFNQTVLTYGPPSSTLTELLSILTQSDLSNIQVFHLGKNLILEVPMSPRLPHIF